MRKNKPMPCNELTWAVLPGGTHENIVEIISADSLVGEFVSPDSQGNDNAVTTAICNPSTCPCCVFSASCHPALHRSFFPIATGCRASLPIPEKPFSFLVQCCLVSGGCSSYFLVSDFTDWMQHYFNSTWQPWRGFIGCILGIYPPPLNRVPEVRPFVNNYRRVWVTIMQHGGLIYDIVNVVRFFFFFKEDRLCCWVIFVNTANVQTCFLHCWMRTL